MKKTFRKIIGASSPGLLFQATVQFQPLTQGTNAGALSGFFTSTDLAGLFNAAFTMALSAGGILAVLMLAYGGWLYMSSDAFGKKSHAKEVITNAILGLLLLIGIYIILYQINPCILNLNVLQSLQNSSCSGS